MTSGEVATAPHPKAQPRRIDPPVQRPDLLLVDDHPLMRQGIRDLVVSAGYQVVGEASNTTGAIELARQLRPAMAIVDVTLEDGSGIELIKCLKSVYPQCKLLVYSLHDERIFAERALRAGALGYLSKQSPPNELIAAIERVWADKVYLSPAMTERLMDKFTKTPLAPERLSDAQKLSDRELEVFEQFGRGLTTAEVASRLSLSVKTVETYRWRIKQKLGIRTNNELLVRAAHTVTQM